MAGMMWGTPIYIGKYRIKNRIAFPALSGNWAAEDGAVTSQILEFYARIARGGCGMAIVSGTAISPEGKGSTRSLCLYEERQVEGLRRLSELIKRHNCFSSIQLMHVGGQGNPHWIHQVPVSPSGLPCKATGYDSRELSLAETRDIRQKFIRAGLLANRAGFQAVELHLAHGYLLHEFLSEHSNKRKDDYGGSLENRMRLIVEIIAGLRQQAPDLILGVRISGEDYLPDGMRMEVSRKYVPILENGGVEYFSITAGLYETAKCKHEAMARGEFFDYAKEVKSLVSKPVIGVGKIMELEAAERNLSEGKCDLVAMGRALVADPFLVKKIEQGHPFKRCLECDQCQYLRLEKEEMTCPLWTVAYV